MLPDSSSKFRIGAVSYLNTVPLIWGMLHGPQREQVDLTFSLPSVCADQVDQGTVPIGLVPVAEIARQRLEIVPGVGIAALGAVRSILLFSKIPWRQVRTLAADISSRTSVELARVILRERFGVEPKITRAAPSLSQMMATADAGLIIGDPALRIDPVSLPFWWLDLAEEWLKLTRLPFVFAAWAGRPGIPVRELETLTMGSYHFGREHLDEIIESEFRARQVSKELADSYLRKCIRFDLGAKEYKGLDTFLSLTGLNQTVARVGA